MKSGRWFADSSYFCIQNHGDEEKDFADFANANGIVPRWYYINQSHDAIVTNIKALIARDIFGNQAYYPIINRNDKTVQAALRALNKHKAAFPITE